jgi:hypothetical protein
VREKNHGAEIKEGHAGGEHGREVVHPWSGLKNAREENDGSVICRPSEPFEHRDWGAGEHLRIAERLVTAEKVKNSAP